MEEQLMEVFYAGLAAADPREAVLRSARVEGDEIFAGGERFEAERVFVVAAGKAAGAMVQGAGELLGERIAGGLVVTKYGHEASSGEIETISAAHPEPDERGVEAARRVEELAGSLGEGDLLLALISGGASALLADPAPPIGLADLKELTGALLRSGANIGEINTVRKHVSVLKGGGLASLAAPAPTLALLLSDVVGDDPSAIASGLTAPDPTTLQETPKPGDPLFEGVANVLCGSGRHAAEAASEKARELGYEPLLLSTTVTGDARGIASVYAAVIREILESGNPLPAPCAVVSGGEATVTVRGSGTGGPNQEFALTLAVELEGVGGWAALAADTDGNDGPTDAAGGLVSGATADAIRDGGADPEDALANNDAHAALEASGALLATGPTGTNVNDLRVALISGK